MLLFQKDSAILEKFATDATINRNVSTDPIKMGAVIASSIEGGPPQREEIFFCLYCRCTCQSRRRRLRLGNSDDNLNIIPRSIDLDRWTIARSNGKTFQYRNITLQGGDLQRIPLPKNTAQLTARIDDTILLR